jgi:uncharacterized membrane protein
MAAPSPYYRPAGLGPSPPRRGIRWIAILIAVVFMGVALFLLFVLLYPASFGVSGGSSPRYYPFGGFLFLFFILIIGFFIVRVAFWGTRMGRYGRRDPDSYGMHRPAMIARMRYARGEISREQYDQIMQDLDRRPGPPP